MELIILSYFSFYLICKPIIQKLLASKSHTAGFNGLNSNLRSAANLKEQFTVLILTPQRRFA